MEPVFVLMGGKVPLVSFVVVKSGKHNIHSSFSFIITILHDNSVTDFFKAL